MHGHVSCRGAQARIAWRGDWRAVDSLLRAKMNIPAISAIAIYART